MRAVAIVALIVAWTSVASAQAPSAGHVPCALVLVVDQSPAMRGGRLGAVANAVVDILGTLDPGDQIAVVGAGRAATVIVPLQSVGQRARIAAQIARLRTAPRGDVVAGLDAAAALLRRSELVRKRVIVISGGAEPGRGASRAVAALLADGVTVSTVGFERPGARAITALADAGAGRALTIDDLTALPAVLVGETWAPSRLDPRAAVFVIDRSLSRSGDYIGLARAAVRSAVEVLAPSDLVAVITFTTSAQVAVPLQPAANRMRIQAEVDRIQSRGLPGSPATGLVAAAEALAGAPLATKHVFVIVDGRSPSDGIPEIVDQMAAQRITISTIGVGDVDRNLLSLIADRGHGRMFMIDDLATLPALLAREVGAGR